MRPIPVILCGAALLAAAACAPGADTPEQEIRRLLRSAEQAAEEKDLSALKKMISEEYADGQGNDRRGILALVRYQFLRNEAVHLLVRIGAVDFPSAFRAEVTVLAAMAGEPVPSGTELAALRADIYRFALVFEKSDGSWVLVRAEWAPARPGDLL